MKTSLEQSSLNRIRESESAGISLPETVGYAGSFMAMGAIALFLNRQWEELTQPQRTATFSLIAISLFVSGLIASNGADVSRRVSSYIYTLATISSFLAVYVTFPNDPPFLQSFALATVVALLGYTISSTLLGHAALFLSSIGTLVGLGYETIESDGLRLFTQASLIIAFSLIWMAMSSIRIIDQDLGFTLACTAILATAQVAFLNNYNSLSYIISVGLIIISVWLFSKVNSWILAAFAMVALSVVAAEFVFATMDNSVIAIIALLFAGGTITYFGIRASNVPKN